METNINSVGLPVNFPGFVGADCRSVFTFWDDFMLSCRDTTVDDAAWLTTETTGTVTFGDSTDAEQELAGGMVALTPSTTSTDLCTMEANGQHFNIDQGYPLYFEARFMESNTGNAGVIIGIGPAGSTGIYRTPASPEVAFRITTDALGTITCNASGNNSDTGLMTVTDGIWYRAAFYWDGVDKLTFWVATAGGAFVEINQLDTDTTTDYIPEDVMGTICVEADCIVAAAAVLYVDYILCQQARCFAPE